VSFRFAGKVFSSERDSFAKSAQNARSFPQRPASKCKHEKEQRLREECRKLI